MKRERKVVAVRGVEFEITDQIKKNMQYFAESEAIMETNRHVIDLFSTQTWQKIIDLLESVNYKMPLPPPTISSDDAREYIGPALTEAFQKMTFSELNQTYRAAHFLKIGPLKSSIGVFLACKIFFAMSKEAYEKQLKVLGVHQQLTIEKISEYKQRFPFIN